jgi:hypothetical protein
MHRQGVGHAGDAVSLLGPSPLPLLTPRLVVGGAVVWAVVRGEVAGGHGELVCRVAFKRLPTQGALVV